MTNAINTFEHQIAILNKMNQLLQLPSRTEGQMFELVELSEQILLMQEAIHQGRAPALTKH